MEGQKWKEREKGKRLFKTQRRLFWATWNKQPNKEVIRMDVLLSGDKQNPGNSDENVEMTKIYLYKNI